MTFRLDLRGPVAELTIDRPAKRNAISFGMWSSLPGLMDRVRADDGVRVLVVRGGEHFSAGADIGEFRELRAGAAGVARYSEAVAAGERALAGVGKPTIAAVDGFCVGGGCQLAVACDLRIAASDARFGITPAKLGIVYGFASTKRLVDLVGPAWTKQILYGAELLDAATALRIGLVNEVHDDVRVRAKELAEVIASRSWVSVRGARTIVDLIAEGGREDDGVRALYEEAAHSADYAEGVAAFLEKRPPRFPEAAAGYQVDMTQSETTQSETAQSETTQPGAHPINPDPPYAPGTPEPPDLDVDPEQFLEDDEKERRRRAGDVDEPA
ncbi:enoyl-CoA hydratase/carnithine racemase [Saccharothrix violaceirubra]|uniref:Enoyl-CoA hydratase/carnithine racemase n=1 Tax=Saccharothrix violaceirubra TaxID=413306 RepID=A0A7W7T8A7_9PSEU|nr:enoyl-CoA hydratase-related protein [Saccharothrix violaceirubra]MBB4967125.1 enoyl-CoA hydratase/carnithine racemase [Saccharothrix violaceirubra]